MIELRYFLEEINVKLYGFTDDNNIKNNTHIIKVLSKFNFLFSAF